MWGWGGVEWSGVDRWAGCDGRRWATGVQARVVFFCLTSHYHPQVLIHYYAVSWGAAWCVCPQSALSTDCHLYFQNTLYYLHIFRQLVLFSAPSFVVFLVNFQGTVKIVGQVKFTWYMYMVHGTVDTFCKIVTKLKEQLSVA